MADEIGFEDKGNIDVTEKGDIRTEKLVSEVSKNLTRKQIKEEIEGESGAVQKKGSMTKDVPQLMFKIGAKFIGCPNFELDENDAQTFATHLNILFPVEGKITSVIVLLMITINKVYICMDAIQAKFKPKQLEKEEDKPVLSEQIK